MVDIPTEGDLLDPPRSLSRKKKKEKLAPLLAISIETLTPGAAEHKEEKQKRSTVTCVLGGRQARFTMLSSHLSVNRCDCFIDDHGEQ